MTTVSEAGPAGKPGGQIVLRNQFVRLAFDGQSGACGEAGARVSLLDVSTGTELLREPEAPRVLWRLGLRRQADRQVAWWTSNQATRL